MKKEHSDQLTFSHFSPILSVLSASVVFLRSWLLLCLLLSSCLGAVETDQAIKLDAEDVDYNGQEICLSGNVTVEHELGKVCAGDVNLETSNDPKKNRLVMLHMKNKVSITFQDGGQLSCAEAKINYHTLRGEFAGIEDSDRVIFKDTFGKKEKDKETASLPLEVQGRNMKVAFDREEGAENLKRVFLKKIIVSDAVALDYNHELFVLADRGIYERSVLSENQLQSFSLPGIITLHGDNRPCRVQTSHQDEMITDEIHIDTIQRQLKLRAPKGVMQVDTRKIEFSAQALNWDEKNDVLTLIKDVEVNQQGFGKLHSDQQVQVKREMHEGKKAVSSIESRGLTTLTYKHPEKEYEYVLKCPGNVLVDHKAGKTWMRGLSDENGVFPDEGQIHFQDAVGEIYADFANVDYNLSPTIAPQKITLKGNVRIYNHADEEQAQYALADLVEFSPETKEMVFAANGKNRVLFFDKMNHLQVSAPKLRIQREEGSKKESIKGFGDVRFSFVEKEFDQLRKRFRFNDEE